MSPHRFVSAGQTATVGISALLSAVVAVATGYHIVLFVLLLATQLADIVSGSARAKRNVGERFDPDFQQQGMRNKMMKNLQLLIAWTWDLAAMLLSDATGVGHRAAAYGVFLGGCLAWMIATEGISVLDNIRATEGKGSVWFGFEKMKRRLDIQNYGGPEDRPPLRRHGDIALLEVGALPPEDTVPPPTPTGAITPAAPPPTNEAGTG